jgi:hypothetical protein
MKRRHAIPGGARFSSYEDAKYFRDNSAVCSSIKAPDEIQIRKTATGFKVVVRVEVK